MKLNTFLAISKTLPNKRRKVNNLINKEKNTEQERCLKRFLRKVRDGWLLLKSWTGNIRNEVESVWDRVTLAQGQRKGGDKKRVAEGIVGNKSSRLHAFWHDYTRVKRQSIHSQSHVGLVTWLLPDPTLLPSPLLRSTQKDVEQTIMLKLTFPNPKKIEIEYALNNVVQRICFT